MLSIVRETRHILDKTDRSFAGLLVLCMMLGSLLEVVGVASVPAFISLLEHPNIVSEYSLLSEIYNFSGAETPQEFLFFAAIGLIGIFIIKNVYFSVLSIVRARFVFGAQHKIGRRLFSSYLYRSYSSHLLNNSAEALRNVKENTSIVVIGYLMSLLTIIFHSLNVTFVFILLLFVEPLVSIASIVVLGSTSIIFLMLMRKKTSQYGKEQQEHLQMMIQTIKQGLGGLKEAIVLRRRRFFFDAFDRSSIGLANAARFKWVADDLPQRVIETIAVTGILLIALVFLTREGDIMLIVPVLTLFATAAVKLMPSMKVIVKSFHALQYYKFALANVNRELEVDVDSSARLGEDQGRENTFSLERAIELRNLHFTYPGSNVKAICEADITIEKGSIVAFVGASGAGKTTIVDLLLGLLTPDKGGIYVDGKDISDHLPAWQSKLGYIPQKIFMLDDTIAANITFGLQKEHINTARIWEVIRIAQLEDFVSSLPLGIDTEIGEEGIRLSGGQRQRIGIARALYHNPEVLVMDEATAALDPQTEHFFVEALEKLREKHTIIMIAHRMSSVRNCEVLFLMEEGKITGQGSYQSLVEENRAFRAVAMA